MPSVRSRTLTFLLMTCTIASCGGSAKTPAPVPIPTLAVPQVLPCLKSAPPRRPELVPGDEKVQTAQLLDYLVVLERWSSFAWAVCKEQP